MPITRREFVPQPFVRGIHVPDVRSLADMINQRGAIQSQLAMNDANRQLLTWRALGQAFSDYQNAVRQRKAEAQALAQREQEKQAAEQLKRDEMAQRKAEQDAMLEMRRQDIEARRAAEAKAEAMQLAGDTVPGVVSSEMADRLKPSGRIQIQDGIPVLMRTPVQLRQAEQDAQARTAFEAAEAERKADNARMQAQLDETIRHNRATESLATQRATEPPAPPKMPAAMADKVAAAQTSLAALDQLESLYNKGGAEPDYGARFLGPIRGRMNQADVSGPEIPIIGLPDAPEGFEDFAAETSTLKNQIIQALSGAAVGVAEQKRIMGQIPDVTDQPSVWKSKVKATRRNLQELMANQIRLGSGAEALAPGTAVTVNPQSFRVGPYTVRVKP